ncbi:uncharacterized protein LOC117118909 [Anneissia japonica]|uniref:uncharacterized protein LOC117118909 n=1 Tax=Anneissia japonica TaxID=1529436 RepID=UPI001425B55A|nr:uncharacterized protein LOC117118909 [Anneissia japonica]
MFVQTVYIKSSNRCSIYIVHSKRNQAHLDDYNDRKDRSNSSSTDSSTHDSRRGSLLAKSKADWRLEPEELHHVLEKVKAEREREDGSSILSPVAPSTDTRLRSRSFPRPRSWNGMIDSGIERANLKSARQMGMSKPQHASGGGQVSSRDTFLETHLPLRSPKKTGERKDYSPGSPTEIAWPNLLPGFINKKSPTSHSRDISRNGNQQNLSGITVNVDSSSVVNNNQISVHNHKTRSLPYNTGSSDVFEKFNKGSDHLGPRCSTPSKNVEVQKYDELEPVSRRRSNSLTRAIDEGRLDIVDEADLRPLDIENDFHLISQITEMNQKMLLNQSRSSSPQNELSIGENNSLSSSINCLNRQVTKPTKRWSFIKESSKAGQRSAPASARMTPVGTPLGSPGLKHKSLRPTKDSYSTLVKFMDYRQRADSAGQSDVERRTLSSRSKEKRKKIQSLLLDQSKSYQSHIGISSPDLLGTQQHSGSRSTVDGNLDISVDARFMPKYSSLQRTGQRQHHKPVQKMCSDSLVNNNNQIDWPQKSHHKPLVRTYGVGKDVTLRLSYSENDGLSEKMVDQRQQMETNLEDSSDSSSLTSFESSIGNLSINSRSPSQATSTDISIEQCDKTDASQNTSPVAKNTISTAVVIRRPKGRDFRRPKSMPNFDSYRVDSASNSSRESSRNMEEEKPPLKARPPKPRRAPRRSKSDLGGKNTIKAALKAAERAAMKEAAEQDVIEKAANEILMNAERLTEKEQFGTLTRRSSGSSMNMNGNIGDEEETEKEDAVVRRNRRRGVVTRPVSDLGPMNFDFNFNGDTTPPRNRKASIPTVLHKVDSPRTLIKRSQSIPSDLHKEKLCNVSNQLKSNGTTDRHPDVIPRHSQSTDTLAEDMCITMNAADDDVLVYGEALWDHVTMDEEELAFKAGDVIGVTDMQDKEWWWGQVDDQEGWFPSAFVRIRVNQNETVEEHFEKMSSGQITADQTVRRTSMSFLSKRQVRTNVVMEILNTEKDYNKHLKDLCEKDGFSIYAAYCSNHSRAITELRQLLRRQRYKHFFEACRLLQAMIEIRIDGFLLTPVQRICKYPLQLAELLKYTGTDHPDYNNVKQALETMRNVAFAINEQKRLIENIEKIAQWQKSIEGWEGKDVLEVSTQSLHSGEVFKVSHSGLRKTGRVLFLFDHQLILCKRDILWRSQLVYKNRINLDSCTFLDVVDTKDIRNAWKTTDHESGKTYVFCTKSPEEKQKWLKSFHRERVLVHEEEERGVLVSSSAREAAMKNAALTEKPIKPSDTLLKRKVPLMPYEYQHEIIKPNVKRMVLPRGISSSDGSEVDTSKRRLLNWFFKGKR